MPAKSRIPRGKVYLGVLVSEEVYRALVEAAPAVYGRAHGSLSRAVEEALRLYLAPRRAPRRARKHARTREVYDEIVGRIMEIMGLNSKPKEAAEKTLELAIMDVRGADPRTVEKWKSILEKAGLIRRKGNGLVELH